MKIITRKELMAMYGVDLPVGKYRFKDCGDSYSVSTVKDDTLGCILVGTVRTPSGLGQSKLAYDRLMFTLQGTKEKITLEVK